MYIIFQLLSNYLGKSQWSSHGNVTLQSQQLNLWKLTVAKKIYIQSKIIGNAHKIDLIGYFSISALSITFPVNPYTLLHK